MKTPCRHDADPDLHPVMRRWVLAALTATAVLWAGPSAALAAPTATPTATSTAKAVSSATASPTATAAATATPTRVPPPVAATAIATVRPPTAVGHASVSPWPLQ